MNLKDLQASTLVGPPRDSPEPDPLAVLHLSNQISMLAVFLEPLLYTSDNYG